MNSKAKQLIFSSLIVSIFCQCTSNDSEIKKVEEKLPESMVIDTEKSSEKDEQKPPKAFNVKIKGSLVVGQVVQASYKFNTDKANREGNSTYNWYRADDQKGKNKFKIPASNNTIYTLTDADVSKYISFEVTPITTKGTKGKPVSSNYIGKVVSKEKESTSNITLYKVKDGEIVNPSDYPVTGDLFNAQQDRDKHQQIWNMVKKVIPSEYLNIINEFMIFWGVSKENPKRGVAGYVGRRSSGWRYAIAFDFAYGYGIFNFRDVLKKTILHEFAHILTLKSDQRNNNLCLPAVAKSNPYDCTFLNTSYLYRFFQTFWVDLWSKKDKKIGFINANNRSDFVSRYAATNPDEDIAETYWNYVLNVHHTPGSVAEDKVNYLTNFPEFERLKSFQRNKLGLNNNNRSSRISPFSSYKTGHTDELFTNHQGCVRIIQD